MSTRGERRHLVTLQGPTGPAMPDADGNWTTTSAPLTPATWQCSIIAASARELSRLAANTTTTTATHILEGVYRPDITTQTQVIFRNRTFYISSVLNPEERNIRTIVLCNELVAVNGA
jgi:head-tail adaptor